MIHGLRLRWGGGSTAMPQPFSLLLRPLRVPRCAGGAPPVSVLRARAHRSIATAAAAGALIACCAPGPQHVIVCEESHRLAATETNETATPTKDGDDPQPQQQIVNLAPTSLRVVAALIDGLLLLASSALTLLCGLRVGRDGPGFDGIDWESFIYLWSHLPTLCTLSNRRNTLSSSDGASSRESALQWPIHCDISPTAFFAHIYCEVWWNGQSPGKWLVGIRTVRMDNPAKEMDSTTAVLNTLGRYVNLLFAVDYWWQLVGVGTQGQCVHNWLSGTTVVWCVPSPPA